MGAKKFHHGGVGTPHRERKRLKHYRLRNQRPVLDNLTIVLNFATDLISE